MQYLFTVCSVHKSYALCSTTHRVLRPCCRLSRRHTRDLVLCDLFLMILGNWMLLYSIGWFVLLCPRVKCAHAGQSITSFKANVDQLELSFQRYKTPFSLGTSPSILRSEMKVEPRCSREWNEMVVFLSPAETNNPTHGLNSMLTLTAYCLRIELIAFGSCCWVGELGWDQRLPTRTLSLGHSNSKPTEANGFKPNFVGLCGRAVSTVHCSV